MTPRTKSPLRLLSVLAPAALLLALFLVLSAGSPPALAAPPSVFSAPDGAGPSPSQAYAVQPHRIAFAGNRETLHVQNTSPGSLDPQTASYVVEVAHMRLVYEGLTRLDSSLQAVPGAAESWVYSADATELTFTLRSGLKYSDGSVLNAERFRYSILRAIDPAIGSPYAVYFEEIIGSTEWRGGSGTRDGVVVHARDLAGQPCTGYAQAECRMLTVGLRHPAAYFHVVLGLSPVYPAREEFIAAGGAGWWQQPQYQVGNGPFVLQELSTGAGAGAGARFTPNLNYWRGTPSYDLEFDYFPEVAQAFQAYKSAQLDILPASPASMTEIRATPALSDALHIYPGSCTYAIMMDTAQPPFDDPKVRQAFAHAFDRDAWVAQILGGNGKVALSWIAPGQPGYDAAEGRWAYSPISATTALADSSYGSAANLPPIAATISDSPNNIARWNWIVARWQQVLGVTVGLNATSSPNYNQAQLFLQAWCSDYPDPQNWLTAYWKTGGFGASRLAYSNPAVDALLELADAATDPATRVDLYMQAQRLVIGDLPGAPIYNNNNAYLVRQRVKGVVFTSQDSGWAGEIDPLTITVEPWKKIYTPLLLRR